MPQPQVATEQSQGLDGLAPQELQPPERVIVVLMKNLVSSAG
jgi:hypothetical protein